MLPYTLYKVVHIVGLVLVMSTLGGLAVHAMAGGTRKTNPARGMIGALNGIGFLLILVGGFGMLARLGVMHGAGFPGWLWAKIAIWGALVVAMILPYRIPALARPMLVALPVLGGLAAYMAIYKPI